MEELRRRRFATSRRPRLAAALTSARPNDVRAPRHRAAIAPIRSRAAARARAAGVSMTDAEHEGVEELGQGLDEGGCRLGKIREAERASGACVEPAAASSW